MSKDEALNVVFELSQIGADRIGEYIDDGHAELDGVKDSYEKLLEQYNEAVGVLDGSVPS